MKDIQSGSKESALSRRRMLLAGTSFAAIAVAAATPVRTAQAQQQPPEAVRAPPSILVIWGDDIGTQNISFNSRGLMGYQTPNLIHRQRRRQLYRLLRAAELHGRARGLHQRLRSGSQRHDQGRPARRERRLEESGRDDGHGSQDPGLRHRTIRRESPGRPGRASADDARLRRVPRQPLSSQRE